MYNSFRILAALLFTTILLFHPFCEVQASRSFGLIYQESGTGQLTADEIAFLEQAGIHWLLVEEILGGEQRRLLHRSGFSVMVMVPEYFPIPYRLNREKHRYWQRSDSLMSFYRDDASVKGFGLFAYGKWQDGTLPERLALLADPYLESRRLFTLDTRPLSGQMLYPFDSVILMTRSADQLSEQLKQNPDLSGVLYAPEDSGLDLRDLQNVLQLLDRYRETPVYFYRDWFVANSSMNGAAPAHDLARVTRFYHQVPAARIANPPPDQSDYKVNTAMLLLFIFWVLYAAYFRLNPLYRKSLIRFFLNYDFFVYDVLMRRIRFAGDAVAVFLISCFAAGIMGFSIADIYLDPVARQALLQYTPVFSAQWNHPAAFFILFFLVMAVILSVQIFWVQIANSQHAHTSQVATFMLWPQHLNMVVVTAGVIIFRSLPFALTAIIMAGIFLAITAISFFTTAYNMRRIHPTSPLYMTTTYVLFVLVSTSVVSWLIFGMDLLKAWELAVSLTSMQL
ncbi:MAG: hypothetical protein EA363_03480 [Balneolaceae bacterium]|nr:MAG: hypothetical protein EA363_03480 [Balneolaceae bacterium]